MGWEQSKLWKWVACNCEQRDYVQELLRYPTNQSYSHPKIEGNRHGSSSRREGSVDRAGAAWTMGGVQGPKAIVLAQSMGFFYLLVNTWKHILASCHILDIEAAVASAMLEAAVASTMLLG